jgi:hypothetical protein
LCVCWGLYSFRVLRRSAVIFLYTSRSGGGNFDIAVSASQARFCTQFLGLRYRNYRIDIAVSASKARSCTQFFGLRYRNYRIDIAVSASKARFCTQSLGLRYRNYRIYITVSASKARFCAQFLDLRYRNYRNRNSPPPDRDVYRKMTADRLSTLKLYNPQHTHNTHPEAKTIKTHSCVLTELNGTPNEFSHASIHSS